MESNHRDVFASHKNVISIDLCVPISAVLDVMIQILSEVNMLRMIHAIVFMVQTVMRVLLTR